MIAAQDPLDVALAMILACKKAFTQMRQVTIFVVNMHLQYFIQKKSSSKHNTKDVPCEGIHNNIIIAVYHDERDLCHSHFQNVE